MPDRVVLAGIRYRLRTGCQWKALPGQFGSGFTCHLRFQQWARAGVFIHAFTALLKEDERRCGIQWQWSALAAALSAANIHDRWLVADVLDAVVLRVPRGPRRPAHLCLDKGYAFRDVEQAVRRRGIVPHIRRKGQPPLVGCVHGKPRRWVVERPNSWLNRFRAHLVRWERHAVNYLGLLHLGCALVALRQAY